ncbi:MAG: hypothetical protein ACRD5L_10750 [Bryobacteraceae bacterium]
MPDLVERIKMWVNGCAANTDVEDLKDALEKGEHSMQLAEVWSAFTGRKPGVTEKFAQAREGLGKIKGVLDTAQNTCLNLRAVGQIHSAIKVLNQDGLIQQDPDAAAKAFGQLFVGFGRLAHYLPPPANLYADILESCGDFFVNMRRKLDPEERWPQLKNLKYDGS